MLRFTGRVDKVSGNSQPAVLSGLTKVPDLVLPSPLENRAPLLFAPTSLEAYESGQREISLAALDLDDGQRITSVTLSGANFAQLIAQTAPFYLLRISPPALSQGSYLLSITATDSLGAITRRNIKLTVKPRPGATALTINVDEDSLAQIQLLGADPDNKPLSYMLTRQPGHGTLTGIPPLVIYRPAQNYNGADSFGFKVSNGQGDSAEANVSINVAPVNDPPQLTVPATVTVRLGEAIQFTVTATDVDEGQTITLSALNLPEGAGFDPASGIFKWQLPRAPQIGLRTVTFKATDNGFPPLSDTRLVTISITDPKAWAPTSGPDGGTTNDFLIVESTVFAATDDGGVFISSNAGANWAATNQGLGSGNVRSLILFNGSVYAATSAGVYRFNGTSWTAVNSGLTNLSARTFAIASGSLLVGTEGGVFRLNPAGTTWAGSNDGLQNLNVLALASSGNDVFAGTLGGGVFRSTNLGLLWSALSGGLSNFTITSFAVRQGNLGYTIYAGTQGGGVYSASFFLLLLTQDGASEVPGSAVAVPAQGLPTVWTPINNGLGRLNVTSLALTDGFVFAGTDSQGIFRYLVANSTWSPANIGLSSPFIRTLESTGTTILAGTVEGGVYKSSNNGANWASSNHGLLRARVSSLLQHGPALFASTNGGGVHQTLDSGTTWTAVNTSLGNYIVTSLTDDGSGVYAGTLGGGVFRLPDNSSTWVSSSSGLSDLRVQSLARNGVNIFAGTEGNGVFRSTNQGASWTRMAAGLPAAPVFTILAVDNAVLAGTQGAGIYRSLDSGATWNAVNSGLTNLTVTSLVVKDGAFFCGTGAGVFRSTNNGSSWTRINGSIATLQILAVAASQSALFAGAQNGALLYSTDGNTWMPYNEGLPGFPVTSLGGNQSAIYVGTDGTGVYVVK